MDVRPSFVADRQPPVPGQPGECPLHHPPMASQPLARLDPPPRDPDLDPAAMQEPAAAPVVVRLVGVELDWALAAVSRRGSDGRHRVDQVREHHAVMAVGAGQPDRQRDPPAIRDQVAFGAWFTAVGGIGAYGSAPLLAGMLALSRQARDQSMRPASPSRSRRTR